MTGALQVGVEVDAERASLEFKQARRDINQRTRLALKAAGEKVALPSARERGARFKVAGRPVAASLVVRSTTRSAYLTTSMRGKLGRAVGLLEFGGTVKTVIRPRRAKAILTPYGPRAYVKGPRHYHGHHFMTDAVADNVSRIEDVILDEILKAFDGLPVTKH